MLSDTLHAIHPYTTTQPMMTQDASAAAAAAAGATQADDSTWAIIGGIMAAVMQHLAIKVRANVRLALLCPLSYMLCRRERVIQ